MIKLQALGGSRGGQGHVPQKILKSIGKEI